MSSPPVSKSELVGEAIDALGPDAKYAAVRDHIMAAHEVTVSKSAYYDEKKRRQSGSARPVRAAPTPAESPAPKAANPAPASPAAAPEPASPTIALRDLPELMKAARDLSDRLGGKETLKQFLDAL